MGCIDCNKGKMKFFKWRYMKNFLKFLYQNIKSGFKQVSYEEYNNRMAICEGCVFFNHEQSRCMQCGCYIRKKAKFKSEECPKDLWRDLNVRNK